RLVSASLFQLALGDLVYDKDPKKAAARLAESDAVAARIGVARDWQRAFFGSIVRGQLGEAAAALAELSEAADLIEGERSSRRAGDFQMAFLADAGFVYHHLASLALRVNAGRAGFETAFAAV